MGLLERRRQHARGAAGLKLVFLNERRIFDDIAKEVTQYEPGQEVSPGVVRCRRRATRRATPSLPSIPAIGR